MAHQHATAARHTEDKVKAEIRSRSDKLHGVEALRGMAALYVFVHHLQLVPNKGAGMLLYFGQEAVILFFLLSGFVIQYSTFGRELSVWQYVKLRLRRIYPIFLIALALAYIAASVASGRLLPVDWTTLVGNLLMLQGAKLESGVRGS